MPTNPLDKGSFWPDRPYGPSNAHTRPQETRAQDSLHTGPGGEKLKENVIWDARSLFREQTQTALETGEYSPDSILALTDLISKLRTRHAENPKETEQRIRDNLGLLIWALQLYDKVPDDYKNDRTTGHPSLVQGNWTGEKIIAYLARNNFKFEKKIQDSERRDDYATSGILYDWENATRMLRIVAEYLDKATRKEQ